MLRNKKGINAKLRHLIKNSKDITDLKEIIACKCKFYKNLSKKNVCNTEQGNDTSLYSINLLSLNSKNFDICESEVIEKDLITPLRAISNDKSPGHDVLTKDFL